MVHAQSQCTLGTKKRFDHGRVTCIDFSSNTSAGELLNMISFEYLLKNVSLADAGCRCKASSERSIVQEPPASGNLLTRCSQPLDSVVIDL